MPTFLDLPANIIELILINIESRYFPRELLPYVLSCLSAENYCCYLLRGMLMTPDTELFDNLYINVFSEPITLEDKKQFRIVEKNFALNVSINAPFDCLNILVSLVKLWTSNEHLRVPLALFSPRGIYLNFCGIQGFHSMHYVNCKELRNFCKGWYPWYNKPTFRCYLKSNDVKHIKELSVTMDDVCQRGRYEFRSLKPEVLNINIDSDKSRYSGVLITESFDLKNVVKFRLSYPKRCFTVGSWYHIRSDLLRVSELDITLGCIENLSEFFRYEKKSISKFRLTLLGSRKLDLFNVASYRDFTLSYLESALTSNDVYVLNFPGSE